jgi:outer membrane protein
VSSATLALLLVAGPVRGPVDVPLPPVETSAAAEAATHLSSLRPKLPKSRWFGRVGAVAAFYHPGASVVLGGQPVPGSSVNVSNNVTVTLDIGFDLTPDLSVMLMVGVPPRPTITGQGAVESLGTLGEVRYGPLILTGIYRLPRLGPVRPYAGMGVAYAVIFKAHDGSVSQLQVHNDWGFVLQAGAEMDLGKRWGVFVDVKRIWISVDADGFVGSNVPVAARVRLDPTLLSAGIRFHFR